MKLHSGMMNRRAERLADETTVHGVKEAWYANWCGRLFWVIVFLACFIAMVFQLRGLFQSYVSGSVGTRVTPTEKTSYLEPPAAEYCNMRWLPLEKAFEDFLTCRKTQEQPGLLDNRRAYLRCHEYEVTDSSHNYRACNCCSEYWRQASVEEVVNQLLVPTEHSVSSTASHYGFNKLSSYPQVFADTVNTINSRYEGSLLKFVTEYSNASIGSNSVPGHGVIDLPRNLLEMTLLRDYGQYRPLYQQLSKNVHDRTGTISLGLNGVCWKVPLGPSVLPTQQAVNSKYYHAVIHLGGFGYSARSFTKMYAIDERTTANAVNFLVRAPDCKKFPNQYYATFMSLTSQAIPTIHTEKTKLNAEHQRVNIRFWTRKTVYLNRKSWPCRSNWTELDQAHCNQNRLQSSQFDPKPCIQYLPGSAHYPETPITNQSCLHFHTAYFFGEYNSTTRQLTSGQQYGQLTKNLVDGLKEQSEECPKPCTETKFNHEVGYQRATGDDIAVCLKAMEAMVVNNGQIDWEMANSDDGTEFVAFRTKERAMEDNFGAMQRLWGQAIPCTLVEYTQVEVHGSVFEDYPLYTLADLASNVGGTLGLWIGASVISFVQGAWICCLHRLFSKMRVRSGTSMWAA